MAVDPVDVVIVPGWQDSGPAHWQTLWQHAVGASRTQVANWQHPEPSNWIAALDRAVRACAQPPVLVAHSLGCIAIAQWSMSCATPAHAALLVAPADVEADTAPAEITTFAPIAMQPLRFPSIVVGSSNDPYDPRQRARAFATAWGSEWIGLGEAGHINVESGFGAWPQGREWLARLMTQCEPRHHTPSPRQE